MRAIARLAAMTCATAGLYVVYLAGRVLTRGSVRWRHRMVRAWARALSRCIGLRATIDGPRPAGAFLLVANHVSYLDILLISQCVDVCFVAKSDVRRWPAIGALAASVDTIFIERGSWRDALRVSAAIDDAVKRGCGVAIFPEGTSSDGSDVLPFKAALLEGAARDAMPVHHAAIRYEPREVAWWGDLEFVPHLWQLLRMPRIEASLRFGGTVVSRDRKTLARELREEVRRAVRRFRSAVALPPLW